MYPHPIKKILNEITKFKAPDFLMAKVPLLRDAWVSLIGKLFRILPSQEGVKVMEKDWDYLIVLDACRYDVFAENNILEGNLEKSISRAPITSKWIKENFSETYPNTIYITANPMVYRVKKRGFIDSLPFDFMPKVWDYGWDEELGTVPPENVTDTALEMKNKYPGKRMIIHYDQPHPPFIAGPEPEEKEEVKRSRNIWQSVARRDVKLDWAIKAYVNNLKLVLKDVKRLVKILDGKIVVTADHGDSFGENWIYGHPSEELYLSQLIEVPWLVIEKRTREKVSPEKDRIKGRVEKLKREREL